MSFGIEAKRLKQLIKVKVSRNVPLEKVSLWTRHIADEVFRSMSEEDGDIEIIVTLDFSGNVGISKNVRKMMMDSLEEELLR